MQNTVAKEIKTKISYSKYGCIFFVASFPKFDAGYVAKLLAQFEKDGLITRIAQGIYIKARKTSLGVVYPSAFELVKEIAKRDKAEIIPTGDTAANRLGFSAQVPMNACFLTSSSSRKLILGKQTIALRHGSPKNFAYKGRLMAELVQALRNIGEANITETVEKRIAALFAKTPETETFEHDILLAPVWIRQIIKRNLKPEQNNSAK